MKTEKHEYKTYWYFDTGTLKFSKIELKLVTNTYDPHYKDRFYSTYDTFYVSEDKDTLKERVYESFKKRKKELKEEIDYYIRALNIIKEDK